MGQTGPSVGWANFRANYASRTGPNWPNSARFARSENLVIGTLKIYVFSNLYLGNLVRPGRFERPTFCSGGKRSIQLSYGRTHFDCSISAARQIFQSAGDARRYSIVVPPKCFCRLLTRAARKPRHGRKLQYRAVTVILVCYKTGAQDAETCGADFSGRWASIRQTLHRLKPARRLKPAPLCHTAVVRQRYTTVDSKARWSRS